MLHKRGVSWLAAFVVSMIVVAQVEACDHAQIVNVAPVAVPGLSVVPFAAFTPLTVVTPSVVTLAVPTIVQQRVVQQQIVRPRLFPARSVQRTVIRSRF